MFKIHCTYNFGSYGWEYYVSGTGIIKQVIEYCLFVFLTQTGLAVGNVFGVYLAQTYEVSYPGRDAILVAYC